MNRPCRSVVVTALAVAAMAMAPAATADIRPAVAVNGLNNPRGLALGPDGSLYYAQAGRGGPACNKDKSLCIGATGSIARLTPSGGLASVARSLPSGASQDGTFAAGVDDVAVAPNGAVYAIVTSAGPRPPRGTPRSIIRLLGRVIRISNNRALPGASVDRIEFTRNPDGQDKESNPYSIAFLDGKLYVADAAGNDLLEVSGSRVRVLTVFPNATPNAQSVPTVVRVGPDGALYVGELTGEKAPNGAARIWRVDPATGQTRVYASGLSRVTGLAFAPDGSMFVSELTKDFSKFTPGDLVRIPPGGGTPQLFANLLSPAGVAIRGNTLFVAVSSIATGTPAAAGPAKGLIGKIVKFPI
jgi:DNA-binding beta-propeller fold protein YncE